MTTDDALLTDLYELTMLQAYLDHGLEDMAVLELFVRRLPEHRGFLVAAGLEQLLHYFETVHFTPAEVDWLAQTGRFNRRFLAYVTSFRFTGDVHALPEGTVFFADEPLVRVTAPLPEAQLVETRVINLLHYQTMVASKAARSVLAAPGKLLVDFGLRRAHGAEAGLLAARASYLVGFAGSSNVLADYTFGIPSYGTMAHSFIQAYDDEAEAFSDFAKSQPDNVILLLDTYDTEAAAIMTTRLAPRLHALGIPIKSVRLDSGDLAQHARAVRRILDDGGLRDTRIFVSGNLDEDVVRALVQSGAPIDGFGIGTRMLTSADAPYLDCAYKLEEYAGRARRKRSEGKATWPGRKQVYRRFDDGVMAGDILTLEDDPAQGRPLLRPVMQHGRRVGHQPTLAETRSLAAQELARLPAHLRGLDTTPPYPVTVSASLQKLAQTLDEEHRARHALLTI